MRQRRTVFVLGLLLAGSVTASAAEKVFKAGAAASNITPEIGRDVIGGFNPYPSTHVHDELHARCLVLDDGASRIAIVICDLLGVNGDMCNDARARIEADTRIPASHVLIAGTHTHSASSALGNNRISHQPVELDDYQKFVSRRIVDGVKRAVKNLAPAKIGWGFADEPRQVFNRRWHMKEGTVPINPFGTYDKVKMNPPRGSADLVKPAGPTDPQVWVLYATTPAGQPIALLGNYSLHYVGGVGAADISADYFAVFADRVQQLLGADRLSPPFVGMMSNGTSGDINNINFKEKGVSLKPYEKMQQVADDTAQAALKAVKGMAMHDWVELGAAMTTVDLQTRKPTVEQLERARKLLTEPNPAGRETLERIYANRTITMSQNPPTVQAPIQALRIGELGIGTMPFEIFCEIGLELKQKSPLKSYFTIELAHAYFGYLPTPAQHELGGYETWLGTNRVETHASEKLAAGILQLLQQLAPRK